LVLKELVQIILESTEKPVCLIIILILLNSPPIQAQPANAVSISVIVYSIDTGERVPYARIQLEGTTLFTHSNENGEYILQDIPAGEYKMIIRLIGYQENVKILDLFSVRGLTMNIVILEKAIPMAYRLAPIPSDMNLLFAIREI